MKLFQQYLNSLSFAALLLALFTSAAECTKRNVDILFWEEGAVEMMWVMRSWGCGGNWRETKVTLCAAVPRRRALFQRLVVLPQPSESESLLGKHHPPPES
jgi:hypothetical protein